MKIVKTAVLFAVAAGVLTSQAFARVDLDQLEKHLSWCMKSHSPTPGQQGVVTFIPGTDAYLPAMDLREQFTTCQAQNADALKIINAASDFEIYYALDSAVDEIEGYVTKHMRWVAYDRERAAELVAAGYFGDAALIRAIYMFEQSANPEARSNLKGVSDVFLINLVATL